MQAMKEAQERRMKMERTGHGCLNEIDEKEFLPEVTTTKHVVAHFYHQEFERCRIMDKHLAVMAKKYFETKFSLPAEDLNWSFRLRLHPEHRHQRKLRRPSNSEIALPLPTFPIQVVSELPFSRQGLFFCEADKFKRREGKVCLSIWDARSSFTSNC